MEGTQPTPQPVATPGEDKTTAILAYCTLVGFIIAIVLHGQKKTALGTYHLRQALGLLITGIACWIGVLILTVVTLGIGALLMPVVGLLFLVAIIMGIVAAANGEMKPNFLLGKKYEEWFKNAFV
jgi:uncharacterized membrane protein